MGEGGGGGSVRGARSARAAGAMLWLEALPGWARWLALRAALVAHAYWIGIGFTSMFSAREVYLSILALTYLSEPVVWAAAHALALGDGGAPPSVGAGEPILTLLSCDLTLEVELCGAFAGFLAFHALCYGGGGAGGTARIGSHGAVALLGAAAPATMAAVGVWGGAATPARYAALWAVGVAGGAVRGAAAASLFASRYALWARVLRGSPPRVRARVGGAHDTIIGPRLAEHTALWL